MEEGEQTSFLEEKIEGRLVVDERNLVKADAFTLVFLLLGSAMACEDVR